MTLGSRRLAVHTIVVALMGAFLLMPAPAPAAGAVDPPRIDRLTGRVLHTADGDTIAIPVPKGRQNTLELLGKVSGGWLVAFHWKSRMLIVSSQGDVVRRIPYWKYEEYPGNADLVLSGDGTRVAIFPIDRGDESPAVVLNLQGRKVAEHRFTSFPTVLAKRGRTFYLSLARGLLAWQPGASMRRVTPVDVGAVSLVNGQIVRDTEEGWGLATLRHPDHLR